MCEINRQKPGGTHDHSAMHQFWSAALERFEKYVASDGRSDLPVADQSFAECSQDISRLRIPCDRR
jgi:hypothetical protein